MIYLIIGTINLIILGLLIYQYLKLKKKTYYAVILDKNGETLDSFKINPSFNKVTHKYENKTYTYLLPEETSFVKHKNNRYYYWEFNKPEPVNLIREHEPRMYADVFNEILQMEKIKALNTAKTGLFDNIDKKYVFIGLVVVIIIIMFVSGVF